jgi:UDP-GlcNAc:undecaprenyl-phosphate GlcNAc-1-phosphate transferase
MPFIYLILTFVVSVGATLMVRFLAQKWQIVDNPDNNRKIHKKPVPLLGGIAIFLSFFLVLFIFSDKIIAGNLNIYHWLGVFAGGLILMIGGFLDDKYSLSPKIQIIFPLLAILAVVLGGVNIEKITNPAGGFFVLSFLTSSLLIGVWLLGLMYTTKLLDGVDGLVSGVGAIGAFIIFLFTSTTKYAQPDIAFAALILLGAILGFLIFNFNPAKIFLGEGGSLFLGYILGVLAIISGGKIAIALLIMGVPILDVAWTIVRRLFQRKNPFKFADRGHLHHRLLDAGLSQKQTVFIFYALSLAFGLSGLFLQSRGKLLALVILFLIMAGLVIGLNFLKKPKAKLLLHICCAPCGAYTISEVLRPLYDITLYFYNSNLDTEEEFNKRLAEVKKIAALYKLPLIIVPYNHKAWLEKMAGLENEAEGGRRCLICYEDRLSQTAQLAFQKKFDYFCTTLTVSPFKNSTVIMEQGKKLGAELGIKFLDYDFKTNNGSAKSVEFAKNLGLYRQKYCGCEYNLSEPQITGLTDTCPKGKK